MHSLGISGFELDPHYCQLPVAEEVQPDRNSCLAVLTQVWIVLDSNHAWQTSDSLTQVLDSVKYPKLVDLQLAGTVSTLDSRAPDGQVAAANRSADC